MAVQKARIYNDPAYTWSDGSLFNGYVILVMAFPSLSGVAYEYATLNDSAQRLRLPKAYKFPIREGFVVSDSYVWVNYVTGASISPPEVLYSPLYYDNADRLISIPNHNWAFSALDQNINAGGTFTAPTPLTTVTGQGETSFGGVPTVETPTGTVNGSNKTFTLSRIPLGIFIFRDGYGPLTVTTDYTLSGATLTMVVAPIVASQFKAYIF